MSLRVVLHVGLQKSGTTFLQFALDHHAAALADHGVHYLVPASRRLDIPNHQAAMYGLIDEEFPWIDPSQRVRNAHRWAWLADRLAGLSGTAVISAEALSVVRSQAVGRVLAALPTDDVRVVVTTRALDRLLVSGWQQSVRAGRRLDTAGYLAAVAADRERLLAHEHETDDDVVASPWRAYSTSRAVQRWAQHVGQDDVTVITSPGSPPELLWQRFLSAAGVPEGVATALAPPALTSKEQHIGLRTPEADVVVALNSALGHLDGWTQKEVRAAVIRRLVARPDRGPDLRLPDRWMGRAIEWADHEATALESMSSPVLGDLADLRPHPRTAPVAQPTPADLARAGAVAAAAVAELWAAERGALTEAAAEEVGLRSSPPAWRRAARGALARARHLLTH